MGKDKTHEGRVSLEELRAVNWKNINWSEFRDTISKDPGVGSSGFFRSIAQEVTNGFSGCSQIIFFALCCLGKIPGGAPFSQLHKSGNGSRVDRP